MGSHRATCSTSGVGGGDLAVDAADDCQNLDAGRVEGADIAGGGRAWLVNRLTMPFISINTRKEISKSKACMTNQYFIVSASHTTTEVDEDHQHIAPAAQGGQTRS